MQILLTGNYASSSCLKYILKVFIGINVSCLTKLEYIYIQIRGQSLSLALVLTKTVTKNS